MKNLYKLVTLMSLAIFSTGCATIVSKSEYPVTIKSTPKGTTYSIENRNGEEVANGVTPDTVTLKASAGYFKGEKYKITFTLPSKGKKASRKKVVELNSSVDGWYLGGNLLFGGIPGYLIVDPLTGAMYKLPDEVSVDFTSSEQSLHIISIDSLTAEQKTKLQLVEL